MKKIILFVAFFSAMTTVVGCKNNSESVSASQADTIPGYFVSQEDSMKSENGIRTRVDSIFAQAYAMVLKKSPLEIDVQFTTKEFYALESEGEKIAARDSEVFIDADHWSQSQDPQDPKMEVKTVAYTAGTDTASVEVAITNSYNRNEPSMLTLKLKWERNNWYIDNFISSMGKDVYDEKAYAKQYVADKQKALDQQKNN